MDQTLVIYTAQGTTAPSESVEEELVLPHLRVRFQEEIPSKVRHKWKIFQNIFMMCTSFFLELFLVLDRRRSLLWALSKLIRRLIKLKIGTEMYYLLLERTFS